MRELQSVSELPVVLAAPYARRQSGFLHFRRSEERRSIRFQHGRIVYATTNVAGDRLGETLVRQGTLSASALRAACLALEHQGGMLGAALLREGFLDERQLVDALEMHTRAVVEPLFAWDGGTGGTYEFAADENRDEVAHRPRAVLTVDLIAAATRRLEDQQAIRAALRDVHRPLVHGDLPTGVQSFVLTEHEAAILRLVDGARTVQDILALRPDPAATLRSLLTLVCTGVIKWLPGTTAARPTGTARAVTPTDAPLLAEMRAAFARAETMVAVERPWEAIQLLEPIVKRVEDPALGQAARVLLARAYLNNPLWVRRAEELLQAVIRENPKNVDALFVLGQIYRAEGLQRRAETMLRRVLQIRPAHQSAAAELEGLTGGGGKGS